MSNIHICCVVCMLVLCCSIGSANIVDEPGDVIGPIGRTVRSRFFQRIDIISVNFFEDPLELDYLYVAFNVSRLKQTRIITAMYGVFFNYSNYSYGAVYLNKVAGMKNLAIFMNQSSNYSQMIVAEFEIEKNQVEFEIPKHYIGSLQPGDLLIDCFALATCGLISIRTGRAILYGDIAPNEGFGTPYEIQQ